MNAPPVCSFCGTPSYYRYFQKIIKKIMNEMNEKNGIINPNCAAASSNYMKQLDDIILELLNDLQGEPLDRETEITKKEEVKRGRTLCCSTTCLTSWHEFI